MLKQDMYVFGVHSTYMYMTCFITFDMQLHKEVLISTATADSKLWATLPGVCGRMRKRIVGKYFFLTVKDILSHFPPRFFLLDIILGVQKWTPTFINFVILPAV